MEDLSLFDGIVMQDELLICDLCGTEDMAKYSIIKEKCEVCNKVIIDSFVVIAGFNCCLECYINETYKLFVNEYKERMKC